MEHKTGTKALIWLLGLAMVLGLLPETALPVHAAISVFYQEASWNGTKVVYTEKTASATPVTSETTTMNNGWYVVDSNVTISSRITISGTVHLILCDGKTLTASAGISLTSGNTLNIYGQSAGTGELKSSAHGVNAGIGGTEYVDGGTLTIHGGVVNASNSANALYRRS